MIDFSGKTAFSTIRFRLGLLLAAAVLPFVIVLLLAYFWVYQPMQDEVDFLAEEIETRFDGVARLQLTLTRSAMPVNDYLIHGYESERREYQMIVGQVEATFSQLRATGRKFNAFQWANIDRLHERWQNSVRMGEQILATPVELRRAPTTATAMEVYDSDIDKLADDAGELLEQTRRDLSSTRAAMEEQRQKLTWLVLMSAFVATMVALSASAYLTQRVLPSLARAIREDEARDAGTSDV